MHRSVAAVAIAVSFPAVGQSPCFPDCDSNRVLNVNDFICFQAAFATPECGGDCNHDNACNVLDLVCFLQAFAAGCSGL